MTATERKRFVKTMLLGSVVTLVCVALDGFRLLQPIEHWLYDRRARDCQYFTPPPTDKLVHLDIDDASLESIGHFPWPRSVEAAVIDELHLAGPKAIGIDMILPEPDPVNDPAFAASLAHAGNVLLPISFDPREPPSRTGQSMVAEMFRDLDLSQKEMVANLGRKGFLASDDFVRDENHFIRARQEAMFDRLLGADSQQDQSIEQLRTKLLPKTDPSLTGAPLLRLLDAQFERVDSLLWLRRHFARPVPPGLPVLMSVVVSGPPVPALARAAGSSAFVNYIPDSDSKVRSIALWADHRGWMYPQMGLALACQQLGVSTNDIRLEADRMVIPAPGRDIVVPLRERYVPAAQADAAMFFDIPWFGPANEWREMYNTRTPGAERDAHIPINNVWDLHLFQERIRTNHDTTDRAIRSVIDKFDSDRLKEFDARGLDPDDESGRAKWIDQAMGLLKTWGVLEQFEHATARELDRLADEAHGRLTEAIAAARKKGLDPNRDETVQALSTAYDHAHDDLEMFATIDALRQAPKQVGGLRKNLSDKRAALRRAVEGRTVIIGWVATAAAADFVPTPLHAKCPGPVVHGVIFNAIMTGEFWWPGPRWLTPVLVITLGLLTTLGVAVLSPVAAALCALLLGIGYLFVNGILLFDYGNLLVGVAGPLAAIVLAWSVTTLLRFYDEIRERLRIKARFQNYVDPSLVQFVVDHPDEARFDGQVREMTVVFTDLAGFTTISETLKEKTVSVLNDYLAIMVPVIKEQNGFVNKFLGDGIMFFYGAPYINPDHALGAVTTTLRMQELLPAFNRELATRNLPVVKMRAGISSGSMIVGDAGGADRSDYTVLGDTVNLGARLESANKVTGSKILMNERTAELVGDAFLIRPIGRIVVVGKTEGVMTFEPLCFRKDATPEHTRLVEHSKKIVDAFAAGDFRACAAAAAAMEAELGAGEFTRLYGELCKEYLASPPKDFRGLLVLTEK